MKIVVFSTFWLLFVKSLDAGRVFEAVMIVVDTGDSVSDCDLKTARNGALFSCLVLLALAGD